MINTARRIFMFLVLLLFILQFFGSDILKGNLVGSVFLNKIYFFDIFSGIETILSSKRIEHNIIIGMITVSALYIVFGRAFCGWICPLDAIFSSIDKIISKENKKSSKINPIHVSASFLILSLIFFQPIFTSYISPVTNFFKVIYSPFLGSISLFIFSFAVLLIIFFTDFFGKRFWCRNLCPIGFFYGIFNKISLVKIKINKKACIKCEICKEVCPMSVEIENYDKEIKSSRCILCGICIEKCEKNALRWGIW